MRSSYFLHKVSIIISMQKIPAEMMTRLRIKNSLEVFPVYREGGFSRTIWKVVSGYLNTTHCPALVQRGEISDSQNFQIIKIRSDTGKPLGPSALIRFNTLIVEMISLLFRKTLSSHTLRWWWIGISSAIGGILLEFILLGIMMKYFSRELPRSSYHAR